MSGETYPVEVAVAVAQYNDKTYFLPTSVSSIPIIISSSSEQTQNIGTQSVQEFFLCDRSIRRTVYSNDLVKFFWVAMYSKKETGNL